MGRLKNEIKLYKNGLTAYNKSNYIEALDYFEKSIDKNQKFFKAWVFKGLILSLIGRYDESNLCYDKAIEIRSWNSWPWQNKGWNLIHLGRYNDALPLLENAIRIAERNSTAWSMKGDCLLRLKKYTDARICFEKALEINTRNECHWNGKGCTLYELGKLDEAISCFATATELNSENGDIWFNRGLILYEQGLYNDSIKCFDKAIDLNEKDFLARYTKGRTIRELGKTDEAFLIFNKLEIIDKNLFDSLIKENPRIRITELIGPRKPIEPEPEDDCTHKEIQWMLSKLGCQMNFDVWVAKNDLNKDVNGKRFKDIPKLAKKLPMQFSPKTNNIIEFIDVLWLDNNRIVAAFEIENTTSIYSGLLRMSDLITLVPNIGIDLYIVAPNRRRNEVLSEINRPTFFNLKPRLSTICRYIPFSKLKETAQLANDVIINLKPSILKDISESCESRDIT